MAAELIEIALLEADPERVLYWFDRLPERKYDRPGVDNNEVAEAKAKISAETERETCLQNPADGGSRQPGGRTHYKKASSLKKTRVCQNKYGPATEVK
ncbi:hypothetical protein HNR65_000505 [Desulfosalsimonas propionicica]|uniref:Uncharacterized protein n=1 Tax=Desulfosalsimonas propionicica TaxID=332175 RepID=A0A7W0C6P9_9BACT|nr:hypothetical protein [Desulfosalsimonas propionicica]MBA2880198.1 hypothetical protein [Desulfosalsimonas propionicica]